MATATLPAGSSNSSDNVVVHPYLFPHAALKTAAFSNKNKVQKQLDAVVITGDKALSKEAASYIGELASARTVLNTALESASVSDTAVTDAAATYLSLLVGLVTANSSSNGAAAAAASPDEALSAAEQGSSSGLDLTAPPSKLRAAVRFEWNDVLVSPAAGATPRTSAAADSLFELASVLVATGVRLMHAAAAACADSATGVTTPASTRAYQLLRQASGMLDFASGQVMPWLPLDTPSRDLDPHLVRGLSRLALADAQQLTVLRAVAKGNQPALIASLATDTASQYRQACSQLSSSPLAEVHSCKLWQYGQYKQAYCTAYAHCFNGVALYGKDSCGAALKSLEAAAAALSAAKQASSGYDAAPPASLNLHHRRTDEDLEHLIYKNQQRLKRDNDKVFLQPIPSEVPPLPEGTCLVSALPYSLPQPAAAVKEGVVERCFVAGPPPPAAPTQAAVAAGVDGAAVAAGAGAGADAAGKGSAPVGASAPGGAAQPGGKGEEAEQQGCSCCRVVVVAICSPILALLWLLGALIWILLLPLKCCFPCCGFPLQWGADAVLWLMRAPARGLMYATGKKEKREGGPEVKK